MVSMPRVLALLMLAAAAAPQLARAQGCNQFGARPLLSGPVIEHATEDGRFLLRWTTEGDDLPSNMEDLDGNGLPDVVDRTLLGLEEADIAFPLAGYREVAPDDGAGGSDAIDVYFIDLPVNGCAFEVPAEAGSDAGSSCTMLIDGGLGDSAEGVIESVAAHELHHCTQYAHTIAAPGWLLEATATFEQYRLFTSPALVAAVEFLWRFRLESPERPLSAVGDRFEYAGFIFIYFWESFGGVEPDRIPALWEALRAHDGDWEDALESESQRLWGQPFSRTFLDFATWNAFACARDDLAHYPATGEFPCTIPSTQVPIVEVNGPSFGVDLPQTPFATAYFEVPAADDDRPLRIECGGPGDDGARVRARLVTLDGFGREVAAADTTGRDGEGFSLQSEVVQDPDGSTLVVMASTGDVAVSFDCDVARAEVPVPDDETPFGEDGCSCSQPGRGEPAAALLLLLLAPKRRRRRGDPTPSR